MGSSPRMRGTLSGDVSPVMSPGIIPAYAGNTPEHRQQRSSRRDHPRVCGEHFTTAKEWRPFAGSSPRMRGTPQPLSHLATLLGIIPAYAGNTVSRLRLNLRFRDHPRVCGEHEAVVIEFPHLTGSSPRMRGTPRHRSRALHGSGIIPAYAGNTLKNPSSESRNPIIELHFNQFAKKVKRCFAIRFRPMRCFVFKVQ